jgi:anaerobic magnesium-protoporphyrin IX monomethyl ester cyclase
LPTKYLSGPQVLRFRDHAFHTYYNSRTYLDMIKRKFGVHTESALKDMASHTLERTYIDRQGSRRHGDAAT